MWKSLYDYARRLLALKDQTDKNTEDIKEILVELKQMAEGLRDIRYEIRRMNDLEQHEREKLMLQLDNALLRFERRLPPPQKKEEQEE